mgnify:CR=1 FL=1
MAARLQLISNLEAQLVNSSASIQKMEMKADVIKSVKPEDKTVDTEVQEARIKMETIRQQMESMR